MIDLENLNNQSFDDIVETAKKQISQLSDDWTNTQDSDPGITLIELFSWLKVIQHNYMNRVSRSSELKFLQLLNINQEKNRGARTLLQVLNVREDMIIPKGTKWYVNDIAFENEEMQYVTSASIKNVDFINSKFKSLIPYDSFDGRRIFELFGDLEDFKANKHDIKFGIQFDKPLAQDINFNLYFDVFLENKYTRNPVRENDTFIDMAKTTWEFYGEKDGVVGWHPIRIIKDNTHRFLFSGVISMQINGEMKQYNNSYAIRLSLLDQDYDIPPRITNLKINVFDVVQKDTLCENITIRKNQISDSGHFSVYSNLAIYGDNQLYLKKDGSFRQIEDFEVNSKIDDNYADFYIEGIQNQLKEFKSDDDVLLLISTDKSISDRTILGSGTGTSSQKIKLNTKGILCDSFDVMVGYSKDGYEYFDKWRKVNDLYSSGKYDKDYVINFEESLISFGDNERGQAPRKLRNNIRLAGIATTRGKESNIRANMIKDVKSENPQIKALEINQITSAQDGRDIESFEDMKGRASRLIDNTQKAVTLDDYKKIVKNTPGLIMENIRIIPSYSIQKDDENLNAVTVVVRNESQGNKRKTELKSYEANIKKYMDKYRLINTKILVSGPTYIGLVISGQIVVNSYYRKGMDEISQSIRNFVDNINKDCGRTLYYGDLFGLLDRLESVSYVDELHIVPSGDYLERTMSEDIIVPPNAVYYIEKLDLSYIKSANI